MRSTTLLKPALVVVSVLAVAALAAAAWFGYGWVRALVVDKQVAAARDDALTGARQAAINLNTVDSANLDQTFANMESSITGDEMVNSLNETRDQMTEQVRQTGAKSEAQIIDAALTDFARDEGTATSLVILSTTTTWPDQPPRKVKVTMRIGLTETDGEWKASRVENVGAPLAMDAGAAPPAPVPDVPAPEVPAPAPDQSTGGQ
ncbi:hypothetical protein ACFWPA_07550 [Rhodococcus sp. NPDC058505]|uniref:hypothetical protein n=1 Tax=unclassified Rhodococcus (in: high G+C Gram-positive bacteria) TaxID=192944 RepID=UPI003658C06A